MSAIAMEAGKRKAGVIVSHISSQSALNRSWDATNRPVALTQKHQELQVSSPETSSKILHRANLTCLPQMSGELLSSAVQGHPTLRGQVTWRASPHILPLE